jgi:hypothetical protein
MKYALNEICTQCTFVIQLNIRKWDLFHLEMSYFHNSYSNGDKGFPFPLPWLMDAIQGVFFWPFPLPPLFTNQSKIATDRRGGVG